MLIDPVTASGTTVSLSTQLKPPENQEAAKRDDYTNESVTPSLDELTELAQEAQNNMNIIHNVELQFSVNEESGRILVTVMDEATGKVIREIPPSELVKFAEKFNEMVGIIFDQKG